MKKYLPQSSNNRNPASDHPNNEGTINTKVKRPNILDQCPTLNIFHKNCKSYQSTNEITNNIMDLDTGSICDSNSSREAQFTQNHFKTTNQTNNPKESMIYEKRILTDSEYARIKYSKKNELCDDDKTDNSGKCHNILKFSIIFGTLCLALVTASMIFIRLNKIAGKMIKINNEEDYTLTPEGNIINNNWAMFDSSQESLNSDLNPLVIASTPPVDSIFNIDDSDDSNFNEYNKNQTTKFSETKVVTRRIGGFYKLDAMKKLMLKEEEISEMMKILSALQV
ncbi:unnamed protein product [Gordionus sp. m RMFG-2023]